MYFLHARHFYFTVGRRKTVNKLSKSPISYLKRVLTTCGTVIALAQVGQEIRVILKITSCSRFSVVVVRTAIGTKATQSSHAASPIFLPAGRFRNPTLA